jgi:hypothetical protein
VCEPGVFSAQGRRSLSHRAMPWLRWLIAGLSPWQPGFAPRSIQWDLWWTKWHWDRFFSEFFGFPVTIIPPWAPLLRKLKKNSSFIHSPFHSSSSRDRQKARKSNRSPVRRQSHPHNQNTFTWCLITARLMLN